jgi:pimeloyl-ACP methyl ester carboxylesterase
MRMAGCAKVDAWLRWCLKSPKCPLRRLKVSTLLSVLLMALVAACATPAQRLEATASELGFIPLALQGGELELLSWSKPADPGHAARALHVYLEGDGTPWQSRHRIAADPTSRRPLMLRLMALDSAPSLYLGRPCYNGNAAEAPCRSWHWTFGRYSETVVEAMATALTRYLEDRGRERVVLLGHSGGGTLAMLLAERVPRTRMVVTLAANLDIDAWADAHGYTRLHDSLNPARRPALDARIAQLHLIGSDDKNVRPALLAAALGHAPIRDQAPLGRVDGAMKVPSAAVQVVYEGFDHVCCWERAWPSILRRVEAVSE